MRTKEDYDLRNTKKQELNQLKKKKNIQVGEIRWYYCGINVGNEIGKDAKGKFSRVCLVSKNNMKNGLLLAVPLSTKLNNGSKDYSIELQDYDVDAWIIYNQACLLDSRRFLNRRKYRYSKRFVQKVIKTYKKMF